MGTNHERLPVDMPDATPPPPRPWTPQTPTQVATRCYKLTGHQRRQSEFRRKFLPTYMHQKDGRKHMHQEHRKREQEMSPQPLLLPRISSIWRGTGDSCGFHTRFAHPLHPTPAPDLGPESVHPSFFKSHASLLAEGPPEKLWPRTTIFLFLSFLILSLELMMNCLLFVSYSWFSLRS